MHISQRSRSGSLSGAVFSVLLLLTSAGLLLLVASPARATEYATSWNYGGSNHSVDTTSESTSLGQEMDASSEAVRKTLWLGLSPADQERNPWLNPTYRYTFIEEGDPLAVTNTPILGGANGGDALVGGTSGSSGYSFTASATAPNGWCYGGIVGVAAATIKVTTLRMWDSGHSGLLGNVFKLGGEAMAFDCGNQRTRVYIAVRRYGKSLPEVIDGVHPEYQVKAVRFSGQIGVYASGRTTFFEVTPNDNNLSTPYDENSLPYIELPRPSGGSNTGIKMKEFQIPVGVYDSGGFMYPKVLKANLTYASNLIEPRTGPFPEEETGVYAEPTVTFAEATNVSETSMVLNGTVNPQGQDGRYTFECGLVGAGYTTISYPEGKYFGFGNSPIPVSWEATGLTPGASYHCRLAAWNTGNILAPVYSGDRIVTIPKAGVSYVPPGAPAPLRQDNGNIDVFTRLLGVGDELDFTRATSGMWTAADLTPAGQPKIGASSAVLRMKNGAMHAFAINTAGDIICHYRTGTEAWNYINLSAYAGATMKFDPTTTPSAVESGPSEVGVYARAVNGDLVSLERRANGTWFMWNESEHTATHPTIAGSPAAVVLDNPSAYANTGLIVFARNASNQLVSFNRNTVGEWTPYNVSEKTGVTINASPTAVQLDPNIYAGSGLGVYTTNANNDLLEFSRATSGTWTIYNVTQNIAGKPPVTGSVAPIRLSPNLYAGSDLGIYARTTDNDLVGFDRKANGAWYFYNVSAVNGFPKISSSPAVMSLNPSQYFGSGLQVHARSTGNELLSFDRFMDGGWHVYNETANVPGHQKVE